MTEYEKARQQYLKSREDTICFTREEIRLLVSILKSALKMVKPKLTVEFVYRLIVRKCRTQRRTGRIYTVSGIEIEING